MAFESYSKSLILQQPLTDWLLVWPEFLDSALLCMADSVYFLVKDMILVLQKSNQAKTRVDLKEKRVGSINGIVSLIGIWTFNVWVANWRCNFWFTLDSGQQISYGLNQWARIVQPWSNAPWNHSLEQKLTSLRVRLYFLWQFL